MTQVCHPDPKNPGALPARDPVESASSSTARARQDSLGVLRRFLSVYWLRPENALWMTLRSVALRECPVRGPSLDLGCGDGIFSFLHAGGSFETGFDVFRHATHLDRVTSQNADMFDGAAPGYCPPIDKPANWRLDVGADLKPALLTKARALDFYDELVEVDANRPLPFADERFGWMYCNTLYWIRDIESCLRELRRVVRADGTFIAHVKLQDMKSYTLEPFRAQLGDTFLRIIDRGRMECWPSLAGRAAWERRFQQAGWRIEAVRPLATRTHAQMWDVGLRPLAPLLVRMANAMSESERLSLKRDWIELTLELLAPLARLDFDLFTGSEPAELQYTLRRA